MAPRGNITPRTIAAPAAAFCMAWVLFAYTRSSINEARWKAQQDRERRRGRGSPSREDDPNESRGQ
ncbi:hypothetical protein SAMD00023353_0403240 [Rosellinia necatrix]|uniref:Uncharacterized protein n=1 Tax=Rosellinia necatrix TaxID=77044 RepID=A0A1S8A5L0_ROSNE|nr:hypothetical protein SAMD00023353_0403240 [Rosellinia necatrix]